MIWQAVAAAFPCVHVQTRLGAEPRRSYLPSRGQQMRVEVARIGLRTRLVNREIHGHLVAFRDLARE